MKNNSKSAECERYKDLALKLLGSKIFCDYISVGLPSRAEPEHFFEEWIERSVFNPDEDLKLWSWRYFLFKLFEYKGTKR